MRRLDEAVIAMRKALELDPLSLTLHYLVGNMYFLARQYEQAIEQFHNALDLEPFILMHASLGRAYFQIGKFGEGIKAFDAAIEHWGRSPLILGIIGAVYARSGRVDEAQTILKELQNRLQKEYVAPNIFSQIYLALGQIDNGFDWLEKAIDERDTWIFEISTNPIFDSLRYHPRYQALMRKMNLEP